MTDQEEKEKRRRKFRNPHARALRENGDHKGAFSLRKINPRKGGPYKRQKLDYERYIEDDEH